MGQLLKNFVCGKNLQINIAPSMSYPDLTRLSLTYFVRSYQHMITKERVSEPPTETIGGILADDMGLGKTLMVISTILRTLDDARFFSENRTLGSISGIDQDVSCRVYSKATLVIVPSPCKKITPI